ncbi:MAG: transcriptional regulator, partial [Xanthobacteraceae bacterium]
NVDLVTYQFVLYAHTWALKHWRLSQFTDIEGYIAQGFDFFVHAMATPRGLKKYQDFLKDRSAEDLTTKTLPASATSDGRRAARPAVAKPATKTPKAGAPSRAKSRPKS